MGLLENDDTAKLASAASAKDHEFENRYTEAEDSGVTKSHGTVSYKNQFFVIVSFDTFLL